LHPEEVQWWIKCKKLTSLQLHIEKPSEFRATWKQWWIMMQLTWHEGKLLVKTILADVDWTSLMHGGLNGISLVVMALSWWVYTMMTPDSELLEVIGDVKWVLSQLVATLSSMGIRIRNKWPCATSPGDEPSLRR
jgi:hypothetical protein